MNRQSLLIIAIIAGGSILSGLAYGVTNGSIVVGNITVTSTCSGCATVEGTYSSWAVSLNSTIAGSNGNPVMALQTGTDGSVIVSNTNDRVAIVKLDGTVVTVTTTPSNADNNGQQSSAQSLSGTYKAILTSAGVTVYKNNTLLTTIGIKAANFQGSTLGTVSVSISPDGKYISLAGEDTGAALDRVVILTGS